MGFPRPFFRGAVAAASASALIASALVLAAPAQADPASPVPVSGTALPTAQVNGVVWAQAVVGGVDYVGGSFNQSQPAGAVAGADVTPRSNLFAYDVETGIALPGFNATANAQVRGIAGSPDGSRIYIVGDFTVVNGQPRNHVAALDRAGNLLPFAPNVNGNVYAVAARGDGVYLGGSFTAVNGLGRQRAAAVSSSGAVLPFAPAVSDYVVRAVVVAPDSSKVVLGGSFTTVNGTIANGLAAVAGASGASLSWGANSLIYNHGQNSSIYSLSARGDVVYATGYVYGQKSDGNLEGAVAMRWSDGGIVWVEDCHGDSYSIVPFNDAVYVATHAHFCGNIGGFEQTDPVTYKRAIAFSQAATGVVQPNRLNPELYYDFGGRPAPRLLDWFPSMLAGTYTGTNQAAWSVAAGGRFVVFGGEFQKVNGVRQTGLTRFVGTSEPADPGLTPPPVAMPSPDSTPTPSPTATAIPVPGPTEVSIPARVAHPSAIALGPSRVAVRWAAPKNASRDHVTGYVVKVYKGSKAVKTATFASSTRVAVISGLVRSTGYRIGVAAVNERGTGKLSALDPAKTRAKGANVSATKKPSKVARPTAGRGAGKLRVKWKAAATKGALTVSKYQVRVVLRGKTVKVQTVGSAGRSSLVKSLKRDTRYSVSVRAANWAGWGAWSTASGVRTR